jgi:hypothetical protein
MQNMDAKSRLILALLMSSGMVSMVTLLVTLLELGLRSDLPAGLRACVRPVLFAPAFVTAARAASSAG